MEAGSRAIVSVAEARERIARAGEPIARVESVPLGEAAGRVLGEPLRARLDVPPFARAAMDGYAVLAADVAGATPTQPIALRIVGQAWAGHPAAAAVTSGCAIAVATGAPIPSGADAVVPVEDTSADGDQVRIRAGGEMGRHVAPAASDLRNGDIVLQAGTVLTPARAGVIAACGDTAAIVFARPRVTILCTGDEIVAPGRPLGPGQIHDVNSTTLAALVAAHGGEPVVLPHVGDNLEAIEGAVRTALEGDIAIVCGGSSVGDRDYVPSILARLATILVHGIAVKPGKPTVFGLAEATPVFAMPGNPASCLSNGYLFLVPLLRRLARLPPLEPRTCERPLASRVTSPASRHEFHTVRIERGVAVPASKGSGAITSMAHADGYIEIPEGQEVVEEGTRVTVTLF
jgi:molybdenum cofactor synthesis domain-containing protein